MTKHDLYWEFFQNLARNDVAMAIKFKPYFLQAMSGENEVCHVQ